MVKVVTDSSSDIPPEVARELDITVTPLYVRFGDEVYRNGIDISTDRFYARLVQNRDIVQTSTPSPGDFAKIYEQLSALTDSIISIHLSPRYSSAINAAMIARDYAPEGCTVHIIDSNSVSMGCGLAVIAAARAAKAGASPEQIIEMTLKTIQRTHIIGMIADINYLLSGRRLSLPIGHLRLGKLGTILRLKLVGEIYEAGKVKGLGMYFREASALNKLVRRVMEFENIDEMAILHAQKPQWAWELTERLSTVPVNSVYHGRLGSATGVHGGPRSIAVAFIERSN